MRLEDEILIILFSGHMIDKEDRRVPRFPARMEWKIKNAIKKNLIHESKAAKNKILGIAGGACGSDILFQESCIELDIESKLFIPPNRNEFIKNSIEFAGDEWVTRYENISKLITVYSFPESDIHRRGMNVWINNNLQMLNYALQMKDAVIKLLAVWDGRSGEGEGGTVHMIRMAKKYSIKTNIILLKN